MMNFLIELSLIHLALILAYWFILRNEQQYGHLRFYLIGSAILSMVIPLLKLPKLLSSTEAMIATPLEEFNPTTTVVAIPMEAESFWSDQLLLGIYLFISGTFLCKFLYNVTYLFYLEHKSSLEHFNGYNIRRVNRIKGSFTFFNWIFLSSEITKSQQEYKMILKHEEAHATLYHSYDLLLFELYTACFWWLPSAWFVQKEIKKIHEYQADAYALKSYNVDQYSSILISSTLKSHGLSLANSFHDGLIFKRLKAMKQQTKKMSTWKLGALTTLCLMLLTIFACTEDKLQAQESSEASTASAEGRQVFTVVEEQPSYKGGMDAFYNFAMNEIRYPTKARNAGIEGDVYLQFVIERNGSISDAKIIRDIGGGAGHEALRVLKKAGSFKAGSQRGRTVRTKMVLPVSFKLSPEKLNPDNSPQGSVAIGNIQLKNSLLQLDVKYKNGAWGGTIHSDDEKPLPGANIVVEGTSYGTVSDLDGTFKLKAEKSQNVHISFVGYESILLEGKTN